METLEDRSLMAAAVGGMDTPRFALAAPAVTSQAAALVDDYYEENDTRSTARGLGIITTPRTVSGLVMADASDYYRFRLSTRGRTSDKVSISFFNAEGDLDLVLFNALGQRVRFAGTFDDGEQLSLSGLAAGTYYIRVYGFLGATNPSYSLSVNVGGALPDDANEDNDSFAAARDLGMVPGLQTIPNLIMADGHDWYCFAMSGKGASSDFVGLNFHNVQGNLALELYNSSGTRLAVSNGTTDRERISLANRAAGTYFVQVRGVNGASNPSYTLQIEPGTTTTTPPPTSGAFDIQLRFSGLDSTQQEIFQQAAARWESIIVGDLPNATYNGLAVDDLLIEARGVYIDGRGNILGQAGPDNFRSGSYLPYHGVMEFDSADLSAMESNGTLLGVILHEMGHVLGIGTLWSGHGLLVGAATSDPRFVGSQAVAAYNDIFGTSASGVPVEAGGGAGTRNAHWRESIFGSELMTGWVGPSTNMPISTVTIGSLADLGYTVNFAAANPYSPSLAASTASESGTPTSTASAAAGPIDSALDDRLIHRGLVARGIPSSRSLHLDEALNCQSQRSQDAAVDAVFANWIAPLQ